MNDDPISAKERRKARAMVRDISRQVKFDGEYMSAEEWWLVIFAGAFGQQLIPNPFRSEFPDAAPFIVKNKRRTKDLSVTNGAELITALYAFGNERGVDWSDPKWKAEMAAYEREAA
jgi:hypothetical protein